MSGGDRVLDSEEVLGRNAAAAPFDALFADARAVA
jgi:hypothetical protein